MHPVWIILFAPLAAAAAIALGARRSRPLSAALSIAAVAAGFVLSCAVFGDVIAGRPVVVPALNWLDVGAASIQIGALVDRLSALMLLVVTGVGTAIHVYSLAYMKDDPGQPRYFACMSLFTFSMLGVVLSANFMQMFIFWELVGVSSYLLIGFWFERDSAADAGNKAFLTNRVADFGFMLGILMVGTLAGTFDFAELEKIWPTLNVPALTLAVAAGLIFCGTIGKSAQVPLHVWLPDAMEGPTPVSAFIHAATMVAAGVYMLCRVSWLIASSVPAMSVVAWTGGVTALMAALIAVTQNDIKRILAYSTLSQLGYMVMAVGLGGPVQAMFHLTTHAFFKALLFLCAGSVIMALHHEQDIRKMGGLREKMPITFWTFLIGTLALAGVWPLSGFYSKDEILMLALEKNRALLAIGVTTALLTAFYMGRALIVVFFGRARDANLNGHARESPAVATLPLVLLATLSVIAGWQNRIPAILEPVARESHHALLPVLLFLAAPLAGFLAAVALYRTGGRGDEILRNSSAGIYGLIERKFFVDEAYGWIVRNIQGRLAAICEFVDLKIIQRRGVDGVVAGAEKASNIAWRTQNGNLRFYAFISTLGMCIFVFWILLT